MAVTKIEYGIKLTDRKKICSEIVSAKTEADVDAGKHTEVKYLIDMYQRQGKVIPNDLKASDFKDMGEIDNKDPYQQLYQNHEVCEAYEQDLKNAKIQESRLLSEAEKSIDNKNKDDIRKNVSADSNLKEESFNE